MNWVGIIGDVRTQSPHRCSGAGASYHYLRSRAPEHFSRRPRPGTVSEGKNDSEKLTCSVESRAYRSSPVNIPSVAYSQNNDLLSLHVKYHPVFSNPETIRPYSGICKLAGELQWIVFEPFKRLADSLSHLRIQVFYILEGSLSINKSILQRPKASS